MQRKSNLIYIISICLALTTCMEGPTPIADYIHITLDESKLNNKTKIPCSVEVGSKKSSLILTGKIKKRGGWSLKYPKDNFTLNMDVDMDIFGLGNDDDYILSASFIDKTFLRDAFSYHLFREMTGKFYSAPTSHFVILHTNDKNQGLYVVHPRVDKSFLKLESSGVLYKDPYVFVEQSKQIIHSEFNPYHQKYPKIDVANKNDELKADMVDLLTSNICKLEFFKKQFNYKSILSWHLYLLISDGDDNLLKNLYLFKKNEGSPYDICLWDCDHSFGRDGDYERKPESGIIDLSRNILFNSLMQCEEYTNDVRKFYHTLRDSQIIDIISFYDFIDTKVTLIKDKVAINNQIWAIDSKYFSDSNSFKDEVEILKGHIQKKIKRLDDYFGYNLER